ncbi:MAG: nuclear transport factor 2 family protein [Pseudonocardiales bacterium]|nr:nuclear transport factor 2 family protein [Pseudonocardiales bacterium]
MTAIEVIRRYYDGCSTGDVDAMRATLTEDVVHFFLTPNAGSAPVRGAEHLARYWRKVAAMIEARWVVDHCLESERQAVIEWTMFWKPTGAAQRVATRGAEWFVFAADGRIAEIRSYYRQRPESTGLDGFPYADRGYSTLGVERSALHEPPPS